MVTLLALSALLAASLASLIEASAASLAGLVKLSHKGMDFSQKRGVCVITGTGLKDTETALKDSQPFPELPADIAAVERALDWS